MKHLFCAISALLLSTAALAAGNDPCVEVLKKYPNDGKGFTLFPIARCNQLQDWEFKSEHKPGILHAFDVCVMRLKYEPSPGSTTGDGNYLAVWGEYESTDKDGFHFKGGFRSDDLPEIIEAKESAHGISGKEWTSETRVLSMSYEIVNARFSYESKRKQAPWSLRMRDILRAELACTPVK